MMPPLDDALPPWQLTLRVLTIPAPVRAPLIELYRELHDDHAAYAAACVAVTQIDDAHTRSAILRALALVPSELRRRADELYAECEVAEEHVAPPRLAPPCLRERPRNRSQVFPA